MGAVGSTAQASGGNHVGFRVRRGGSARRRRRHRRLGDRTGDRGSITFGDGHAYPDTRSRPVDDLADLRYRAQRVGNLHRHRQREELDRFGQMRKERRNIEHGGKAGSTAAIHQAAAATGALKARDVSLTLKSTSQSLVIRDFRPASTSTAATLAQTGGGVPALPIGLGLMGLLLVAIGARLSTRKAQRT